MFNFTEMSIWEIEGSNSGVFPSLIEFIAIDDLELRMQNKKKYQTTN